MSDRPPATGMRYAPPRLTRNEAEARTLLAQHVQRRKFLIGDKTWEISMEALAQGTAVAFGSADWLVRADWGGAPFELRLPAAVADRWLRARFASLELPELPAPLRSAAFESAMKDILGALQGAGHGAIRIESVDQAALPPAIFTSGHHFGVALIHAGSTLWATLSTDALGLMLMGGVAAQWTAARGPITRSMLPVVLRAEIGTTTLSCTELESLRVGDSIVLQHSWADQDRQLWLGHAGWGLRVREESSRFVVTEPFHSTERHMNDDIEDPAEARDGILNEPRAGLDSLPVRLHFDVGQRTMSLAEVRELQVGQVLELTRPLSQAVSIRANGALIGTGELMEIGGRIAVGIISLGAGCGVHE